MQVQKQIHASQLWEQWLNEVTLSHVIPLYRRLLRKLFINFFSLMSAQARNCYYEKVCFFDHNIVEQKKLRIWTLSTQWCLWKKGIIVLTVNKLILIYFTRILIYFTRFVHTNFVNHKHNVLYQCHLVLL